MSHAGIAHISLERVFQKLSFDYSWLEVSVCNGSYKTETKNVCCELEFRMYRKWALLTLCITLWILEGSEADIKFGHLSNYFSEL